MDLAAASVGSSRSPQPRGGYASLSRFIGSDKDLFLFRRFDSLAARQLLYLQDELCEMEQRIDALDQADMDSGIYTDLYSLHTRRYDKNEERVSLMAKSAEKLKVYEKALLRRSALLALPKPDDSQVTSLANWIDGKQPTIPEESHFLDLRTDLVPLSSRDDPKNSLERFLETYCHWVFVTAYVSYYSFTTVRRAARLLVTLAAVLVITGPTFALYFATRPVVRLALMAVFALGFALVVALTTTCKNQEMFAIVAAYAAVMIVFVGNSLGHD